MAQPVSVIGGATVTETPEKPLFIPLNAEWFDAFERGYKREEYRPSGGRWNDRTCRPGRRVTLSRGYGKQQRLHGVITGFRIDVAPCALPAWRSLYGDRGPAAVITIELDRA